MSITLTRRPEAAAISDSSSGRLALLLLLLYFGVHLLARVLISDALELDEAEQALWTQSLQAGYGTQPPLYTWLQWGVFKLLGVSVFSLALLKNILLALTYVFVFLAARVVLAAPLALLASASMLLLPQIAWESQRDLTHSVLLTTLAAFTLYVVLQLLRRPSPALYLALGLGVGLGMLAKYSFAVYIAALGLATLLGRETRTIWRSPWMLAAGALALLIVAPHGLWLLDHWRQAAQGTIAKLDTRAASGGAPGAMLAGILSLSKAAASFLGVWIVAMLALFGRAVWQGPARAAPPQAGHAALLDSRALWVRYAWLLLFILLGMVVAGGVTRFKDRWMQPVLFMAPLVFFACRAQLATHPRLKLLPGVLAAVAALIFVLLSLRVPFLGWRGQPDELNEPARELAEALRRGGYDGQAPILATDRVLGGVLRVQFPQARVHVDPHHFAENGPLLVIEKGLDEARLQASIRAARPAQAPEAGVGIELPYRYSRAVQEPARYRYALLR